MMEQVKLATLALDGWELDDAEFIAQKYPATFWLPPLARRKSLRPGHTVKLIFRIRTVDESMSEEINVERMWVTTERADAGFYFGKLDNNPLCTSDMAAGLDVVFQAQHVIGIWEDD